MEIRFGFLFLFCGFKILLDVAAAVSTGRGQIWGAERQAAPRQGIFILPPPPPPESSPDIPKTVE